MSALPPVPDLIPISALRKSSSSGKSAAVLEEVMGEQRSRRSTSKTPVVADLIDSAGSRANSAAPQARKPRPRKSDRRREHHRKPVTVTADDATDSKQNARRRSTSPERPANPRVNPIFVFVRQIDTRIVDVKCEDYDKRNRIVLTKTAQGWRAIPRTETFVPALKEAAADDVQHYHHHHKPKKSKKNKRRKSAAVQVGLDLANSETEEEAVVENKEETVSVEDNPPKVTTEDTTWLEPVNVESLLPSHTICVKKSNPSDDTSEEEQVSNVNSDATDNTQTQSKCSADQIRDVSPLDNLLAVAELEWNKDMHPDILANQQEELDQINEFIEEKTSILNDITKQEECDYNEDEDNNIVMDDILTRLEQSLRSPETKGSSASNDEAQCFEEDFKQVPELETLFNDQPETKPEEIVQSSDEPTDLSIKNNKPTEEEPAPDSQPDQPTDLSVPKNIPLTPPPPLTIPRPQSQNSEAIQSPQPSGIPAVPPSPDIVSTSAIPNKSKPVFLETLLSSSNQKNPTNSEVTIVRQKEPLDLGKFRKSASPTVTCSEEASTENMEPPAKKFKPEDITLKNLLTKVNGESKSSEKPAPVADTPRLLELLKNDSNEPDPLTQFRQVVTDPANNVPDPMLIPKERLSDIITHPGREIPRLMKQRPELRLPDALNFPHLMNDPDILVITQAQVEQIVIRQSEVLCKFTNEQPPEKEKPAVEKPPAKPQPPSPKRKTPVEPPTPSKPNNIELANDIDAATTAAFNQMMWLPYLNQLEAMSFANNPEFMKMFPMYPGQNMFLNNNNRFPTPMNFPLQPPMNFSNPLEMSMWQEAMMQANLLRPKLPPLDNNSQKAGFREYMEKMNFPQPSNIKRPSQPPKPIHQPTSKPSYYPSSATFQNQYLNMPPNTRHNLQVPQFNPLMTQQQKPHKPPSQQKPSMNSYYGGNSHKSKVHSRSGYANAPYHPRMTDKEKTENNRQPIDLSGGQLATGKLKVKQHLIDPMNAPKLLKLHEDVPEVGSTTASIEEMQDAHKHLWHPLFGNQKGYNSPWNWTTVTATGE